ncbi:MAG: DNA polymerase I [Clostridiaceae bacterium]|nr:DNA polymerase I [Clostridiaceae bacterium]
MDKKKLMIVDGNSILNRAFYGIQFLSNSEGLYTNAIYGFLNILFKYMEEEKPDYICVAFDMKAPTFRHKEYEQYKAHRKKMPDELAVQLPIMKQILAAMNITVIEKEGYEADDIIGTVSHRCEENDIQCIIVTGDRDSLQLASCTTRIKLTTTSKGVTKTEDYDEAEVFKKYGVTPRQFIDVKGLMGDPSDNIPGVPGIGEKTAFSLIQQYKSIENIYENIEELNGRKKQALVENREIAFLSKKLATIDRDVPIDIRFEDCRIKDYNREELLSIFRKLEFNSFIKKLGLEEVKNITGTAEEEHQHITSMEMLKKVVETVIHKKELTYLLYTQNMQADYPVIAISIALGPSQAAYIDFNSDLKPDEAMAVLKPIFEDENIRKIGHNIKDDIVLLNQHGIKLKGIFFDTMIASYIMNPSRSSYAIDQVLREWVGENIPSMEDILGKGRNRISLYEIDKETAVHMGCRQVLALPKVFNAIDAKLEEYGQKKLYYEVELPLVEVLADMQIIGFKVDREKLRQFSLMLDERINEVTGKIYALAGEEFNINSTKQLGVILFDKLGLPVVKKTKTGYSTDVEVLEKLKGKHEIISLLIEYRQLVKLKSTYADGLLNVINPQTGKIHSSFNQTVTVTGRISSTEPNLQNIPIKLELGREIRKMFIASSDEYVLLDADYSQIELRVLAHISDDPNMIEAFNKNEDIHKRTASQVFGVPIEEVTPAMRGRAKAVNFGIVYGIGDFSLAQDLGITRKEAKQYIDNYFSKYSKVHQYMTDIVELGKKQGYVTTLLNRRRYIPELQAKSFVTRSFGERIAMNTPIQGTAADIIKIAMVNVYRELKRRNLKSRLILQVHDELIVETHKSELEEVKEIVRKQMEQAMQLKVPLVVDLNTGDSWYDAK